MESIIQLVVIIGIIVFIIVFLKKRKKSKQKSIISGRKNKNEVWKTIKEYLRKNNESGMEIIDCFSAKRPQDNYVDPHLPRIVQRQQKALIDIRRWQNKPSKKGSPSQPAAPVREIYVICFQTKNNKTKAFNHPQAFECEVVRTRVSKLETKQNINILGTLNFDTEMEWIAPIRAYDLQKTEQSNKRQEKAVLQNKYIEIIKKDKQTIKAMKKQTQPSYAA